MSSDRLDEAVVAFDRAVEARAAGDLDAAMDLAQRALVSFAAACPDDDPDVVNTMTLVARIAADLGRFQQALDVARAAYERSRGWPCESAREVKEIALEAAVTYGDQERVAGGYAVADRVLSAALADAETAFGPHDPVLVAPLNCMGILCKYMARFEEARGFYLRAVELVERAGVPDGASLAALCHNLGGLAHAEGAPARGIPWAERGLAVRGGLDGDQEVALAADLGALGGLYAQAGRLSAAERTLREAVDRFTERLGSDHYEVGAALGNLGHVLARASDPTAEGLLRRSLEIKTAALGSQHPDLAVTLANLGAFLSEAGNPEGVELLVEADRIASGAFGENDPRLDLIRELARAATETGER